jgi:hypothetical protein
MGKDHLVLGRTTMFFKDGSPSGNHGVLVKYHPWLRWGEDDAIKYTGNSSVTGLGEHGGSLHLTHRTWYACDFTILVKARNTRCQFSQMPLRS